MSFDIASKETTEPNSDIPVYAYPRWFAGIRYALNYLQVHEIDPSSKETAGKYESSARDLVKSLFLNSLSKDFKKLSAAAVELRLIEKPLDYIEKEREQQFQSDNATLTDAVRLTAADRAERERAEKKRFDDYCDTVIDLMDRIAPKLNPLQSSFYKNMKMLGELYGLNDMECRILALHSEDVIIARIAERSAIEADDNYEQDYSKALADCLGFDLETDADVGADYKEKIYKTLFGNDSLEKSGLLFREKTWNDQDVFFMDQDTLRILQSSELNQSSLLEQFIGKRAKPKLRWDKDFSYIPWNQEIILYLLGTIHRTQDTLGKSVLLEGEPGSGKTTGVPAIAATIEHFMHKLGNKDFELPVYVIGVDATAKSNTIKVIKSEKDGANNAADAVVRKLKRARYLIEKSGLPAILMVEEADGFLATMAAKEGTTITRADRNDILEHSPVPTFYLTNHPDKFDEAAKRRFIVYRMDSPPHEVRVNMILDIGKKTNLRIQKNDAIKLATHFEFTPGVIESALLMLRSYKMGEQIINGDKNTDQSQMFDVSFDEIKRCFSRKQVGLVGTNLELVEKLQIPETLDPDLYFPSSIKQEDVKIIAEGSGKPKVWLMAGLPATETTELALYAAKQAGGEVEIIDLNSFRSDFQRQLETAVTYKRPIVIVGAEGLLPIPSEQNLESMPVIKALKHHVQEFGLPVYLVAHASPNLATPAVQRFFSSNGFGFAGFHLAVADELLGLINKVSGLSFDLDKMEDLGLICAGPADVRKALASFEEGNNNITIHQIADALGRIAPRATTNQALLQLTGLRAREMPSGTIH